MIKTVSAVAGYNNNNNNNNNNYNNNNNNNNLVPGIAFIYQEVIDLNMACKYMSAQARA